jgi:hypothetical protein
MPCERDDGLREEPRHHRALPSVRNPRRKRKSQRFETTHEEKIMPTKKPRHPRTHAPSLQRFALDELAPFTKEGVFAQAASRDFHLFYVGRDDVHAILKYLLSRATTSLYLNMFGHLDPNNPEHVLAVVAWLRCAK